VTSPPSLFRTGLAGSPPRWPVFAALVAMACLGLFFSVRVFGPNAGGATDAGGLRMIELRPIPTERATVPALAPEGADLNARADQPATPPAVELGPVGPPLDEVTATIASLLDGAELLSPAAGCTAMFDETITLAPPGVAAEYRCPSGPVVAPAEGRVLMTVADPGLEPVPVTNVRRGAWQWSRGLELGKFVVIDHGSIGGSASVISVHSRLGSVDPELTPGDWVAAGAQLGTTRIDSQLDNGAAVDPAHVSGFTWEVWIDNQFAAPTYEVSTTTAVGWAEQLATIGVPPVEKACRFPGGSTELLPNAPRYYRSGVHQGVDFNCGRGHDAFAFADGQVVLLVDDFENPTVAQREQTLANAGRAGSTPHWILAMLYGNVVVIDHGDVPGVGRVTTISAHLDSVDPAIQLGQSVLAGQRLGEIGNAGTNAGSLGNDATLHLHWELLIDGTHLGNGLGSSDTRAVYGAALCDDATLLDGC